MKMTRFAAGIALIYLMLCAGCTSEPPVPMPPSVIVYNACPKVSPCPMPGSDPVTNGDLSADIRQLENALKSCAIQVDTVKQCQDEIDAKAQQSAKSLN